jgi:hypothetical protein
LGNVAARLPGQKLDWDSAAMEFTNVEAANKMLTKSYRKGFEVEAVG